MSSAWAKNVIWMAGGRVEVVGLENIPKEDNVCFISNHQGCADIPLMIAYMPKTAGFIAKKELGHIPILSWWMRAMHCVFIDRKNKKQSLKAIQQGIENIKQGHAMVIFPEGTRSKGKAMGKFKPGSLKIALQSNALIVPLTVNGTYKLLEEKGWITPGKIKLIVHPPIDVRKSSLSNKNELAAKLRQIIESGLTND